MKQLDADVSEQSVTDAPVSTGVTPRAVIIGFALIVPAVFWGVYGEVVSQTDLTSISLTIPPLLILTALIAVNAVVKRIRPISALSRGELITVYVMLTVAVVLSGIGMLQGLCTSLGAVPHYADPVNGWGEYTQHVPGWIMPRLSAIDGFYKGNVPVPWSAWRNPIIAWSGFLFVMLFCMMCINTMMRKQWVENERLIFPVVQLPLEMTDTKSGFFGNRAMWAGFCVAAFLETLNSLHFLYPNVPGLQLRAYSLTPALTASPWNSIGGLSTTFYPLAIGLGYVLSAEVSFSCWFFYLLTRFENVYTAAVGWNTGAAAATSSPPYLAQQGAGAFIGITIVTVWLARKHLADVFAKAFMREKNVDDSNEPMGYGTAVVGLIAGFVVMVGLCSVVGVSPFAAAAYLGMYLVFATTISRLRADAGPAWVIEPGQSPLGSIVNPVGSAAFGRQTLIALSYFNWFGVEMRCCPMAAGVEGMKMAREARIRQRAMMIVMLAAIVAGVAVGFAACLKVWYTHGAGTAAVEPWRTAMGKAAFACTESYLRSPTKPDIAGTSAMTFGAGFTFLLGYLRSKFAWFPLHPAGYVLANTPTMDWLWCPFLIAWLCKTIITRYAGIKGYRAALPFFLGLVLGDYVASGLWALAGSALGMQMYRCFPC